MIMDLSPQELKAKLAAGWSPVLVDVRRPEEWNFNRLPGAVWIPLDTFADRAEKELPADAEIVIYCHHGMRSDMARKFLVAKGYANVFNLTGGIDAWSLQVDPTVPRY
jgi:adenylyltransferase/sulfurtransferase